MCVLASLGSFKYCQPSWCCARSSCPDWLTQATGQPSTQSISCCKISSSSFLFCAGDASERLQHSISACMCFAVGSGQDGTATSLLGGAQPAPGGAMGLSQSHMNGAAPRPELASGILDLSSSPDSSPVKVAFTFSLNVCRLIRMHLMICHCGSCLSEIYA